MKDLRFGQITVTIKRTYLAKTLAIQLRILDWALSLSFVWDYQIGIWIVPFPEVDPSPFEQTHVIDCALLDPSLVGLQRQVPQGYAHDEVVLYPLMACLSLLFCYIKQNFTYGSHNTMLHVIRNYV